MGVTAVHERSGLAVLGLILFRIIWGFIGSQTARFSSFVKSPAAVLASARNLLAGQTDNRSGHSALGGYATLILLAVCLVMAGTGSFSTDDILYDGPFAHLAPDYVKTASRVHHLTEKILFAVIALHFLALFMYFWRLKKSDSGNDYRQKSQGNRAHRSAVFVSNCVWSGRDGQSDSIVSAGPIIAAKPVLSLLSLFLTT